MGLILFVCIENSFRSILSEAIFNARAPQNWRAESAGVKPAKEMNPVVVDLLQEVGIFLPPKTPRLVTSEMVQRAWRVISFGCIDQCPVGAGDKHEDWPLPGSTGKTPDELRTIRDEISRRVDILLSEILRSEHPYRNL